MTTDAPNVVPGAGLLGEDRLVAVPDGRRLRAMVAGSGDDLVVLEAGLGVSGLYWGRVHELLADHARVVAYERAGYGGSDPGPAPRDLEQLAADLTVLLNSVPHERLVLVGHSWGGPIVRLVAARLRNWGRAPAGVVLVDQSDEHAELYFSAAARVNGAAEAALLVPLARLRLLPVLLRPLSAAVPQPLREAVIQASSSVSAARAAAAERRQLRPGLRQLRQSPPQLGATPVRLLSGLRAGRLERGVRTRLNAAHRATAAAHQNGRFIGAARSGHLIPLTEPELIVREVRTLLAR